MKRHEALSVGEIIDKAIASTGERAQYDRQMACFIWGEIVGPSINRLTTRRWIDGDVMHVCISGASIKNDLSFRKEALAESINSTLGKPIIKSIVIH